MSKSTPSSLLWAFLIIGLAGLVLVILAVNGVLTAGIISGIGILLLALGIVGSGFIAVMPGRTDALSSAKATAAPLPESPAPSAAVVPPAPPVAPAAVVPPVAPAAVVPPVAPAAAPTPPAAVSSSGSSQSGFASIQRTGSFSSPEAPELDASKWVFALASSPTIQHTYQIRARHNGGTDTNWLQGGGIVEVMVDSVPTGTLMVIANKKSAKEDIVAGSRYRIEMAVISDGLAPATVDTQVSVDGFPLAAR